MSEGAGSSGVTAQADDKLRWELYNDHKKQSWEDIQSSTDSYDQSLLTLSSGILALSIGFIKDIVPLADATRLWLLYFSWVGFASCIFITVISFQVAIAAQREHLDRCWKVYVERKNECRDERGKFSKCLDRCTIAAGMLFVFALACTIVFAVGNVEGYSKMQRDAKLQDGRVPVSVTPLLPQPTPTAVTPSPKAPKKD